MSKKYIYSFISEPEFIKTITINNHVYYKTKKQLNISRNEFNIEIAEKICNFLKIDIIILKSKQEQLINYLEYEPIHQLTPRVTIMGHIDHGKTSFVDYLLKENTVIQEAGGITQTISLKSLNNKYIIIDTPGHQLFSSLREYMIQLSSVVVLIVSAADGIKDQSEEILKIAEKNHKPLMVVVTKIDKYVPDMNQIYNNIAKFNYIASEYGGDIFLNKISVKTGIGIKEFMENLELLTLDLDLKTDLERPFIGLVVDIQLKVGLGYILTILGTAGKICKGDFICCGINIGRVKLLYKNNILSESANANDIVSIVGVQGNIGERVVVGKQNIIENLATVNTKELYETKIAKTNSVVEKKEKKVIEKKRKGFKKRTGSNIQLLNEPVEKIKKIEKDKEILFIGRVDTGAKLSTFASVLNKYGKIFSISVGNITEHDIEMANTFKCIIVMWGNYNLSFNTNVNIIQSDIIYRIDEQLDKLNEKPQEIKYKIDGVANILKIFNMKNKKIAGCRVTSGVIVHGRCYITRNGVNIAMGAITSMKREKDDIKEAVKGSECGLIINYIEKYTHDFEFIIGDDISSISLDHS